MVINIEPPKGLLEKIMKRIHEEERILVLRKTIFLSITSLLSIMGFVLTFNILMSDLMQSGFLNFSFLIFSDFYSVTAYWKSFAMILLETLPAVSLVLFLTVVLVLLQSALSLFKNIKIIKHNNYLTINYGK